MDKGIKKQVAKYVSVHGAHHSACFAIKLIKRSDLDINTINDEEKATKIIGGVKLGAYILEYLFTHDTDAYDNCYKRIKKLNK